MFPLIRHTVIGNILHFNEESQTNRREQETKKPGSDQGDWSEERGTRERLMGRQRDGGTRGKDKGRRNKDPGDRNRNQGKRSKEQGKD